MHLLWQPVRNDAGSVQSGEVGDLRIFSVRRSRTARGSTPSYAGLRAFWRQTALLLVVLAGVNGSNYLFHVVISRMLGPADYGAIAALLAVVLVLSVPFGVVQTAIADRTATRRSIGGEDAVRELGVSALKTTMPFAWAAGVVVALLAPLLSLFLDVDIISALLLAPFVVASVPTSVAQGVLQGDHRFQALAALQLTAALLRLALGIALVWAGLGVIGAVLATALSAGLVVPVAFAVLRVGRRAWRTARRTLAAVRGDLAPALLGLTCFWLLAEADIALARHFLGGDESGYYSSAGLLARALLFLPAAVGVVAFPRFVAARSDDRERLRWLQASTVGVGVLAVGGFAVLLVLREPLIVLAFGERFADAADLLPILAVAMGWMAVVNVLVYFHIAMASRAYLICLAGVVAEAAAIAAFHETAEQVAVATAIVAAVVAFLQYEAAASICRWGPRTTPLPPEPIAPIAQPGSLDLSVVLPCHNAGPGFRAVVERLLAQLGEVGSYELIVVSDGSTDETVATARSFAPETVRVIEYPLRAGKGHALRVGLREARGEYVAFCDADGDIAAEALPSFLTLMRLYDPDVVLGSKRHPLSDVYYPPARRLLSWTYHKLTRLLFRVNVRDTQTGLKLIRRDVLAAVLPRMLEKRYAFDLEFLVIARSLGFGRVFEAPVRIDYRFASHVDPRATLGIVRDTLAIFYRHHILDTYRSGGLPGRPGRRFARAPRLWRERARVCFINWRDVENPEAGGAEIVTHEVAKRWAARGYDVTQLSSGFAGAPATARIDGVHVRRLGRLRTGSFHLRVQRELARLRGFDVVIESVNTIPFLTPLWRSRLPATVPVFHQLAVDVWDAELPGPVARVGRWLEFRLLRLYRETPVVAVSPSTRDDLVDLGFAEVAVVANGRDEPPDLPQVPKEVTPTFLFVGRLTANKRPRHALDAFRAIKRELPDARLWIVGRGPLEAQLRAELPPGAELLGRLSRRELYERMARAHCLLVPSVREGWGLVVVEANAVGTPAVGYDVPGIRDSIRPGETGVLVPAGDTDALGHAAAGLVGEPERYERLRRAAIEWGEGFSWDATADALLEFARRLSRSPADPFATAIPSQTGRDVVPP
jgi:glycosyltransferase involved in cell wall biosynthesis/O-antigen/teichoic acid export membrane protein